MKVSEEFVVGKNNIGWVDSDFKNEYKDEEFEMGTVMKSTKLTKSMNDAEIIKEFGVEECTLGDVLATLNAATDDMKDGFSNLFYIKGHSSHVVRVYWYGGRWRVRAWDRRDISWYGGERVFSPATFVAKPLSTSTSDSLNLDLAIKLLKDNGYKISKEF